MKAISSIAAGLSFAAALIVTSSAWAAMSPSELARLDKDLTPNGAERAGNKDGSIPAWDGGLTQPPPGWKPETGYADPFANEKPLFVITAANADQYKDKLSAGLMAMLKKYPTFNVPVYPTHRTYARPAEYYEATKKEAAKAEVDGLSIKNFELPGTPFPVPKNGVEEMYNHLARSFGGYNRCANWIPVKASGDYYVVGFCEENVQDQNMDEHTPNHLFSFYGYYDAPASLLGTIYLVRDPIDYTKGDRQAWLYNAGQRRVRRAPDLCCDTNQDGDEGMRTTDGYWGFHGTIDRYDWKLVGKQEMYIPYNDYKLNSPTLKYADMLDKGSLKSDLMRYELHRVWVVEATLRSGMSHLYAKRTFYLDEDSHLIALEDMYDGRGNLWRTMILPLLEAYDAKLMFQSPEVTADLINGNYLLQAMTNERKQPAIIWNAKGKAADFDVDAIRRRGTK